MVSLGAVQIAKNSNFHVFEEIWVEEHDGDVRF